MTNVDGLPLMVERDLWQYLVDVAQIVTGVGAISIPIVLAALSYARRPSVSLAEDRDRIQSRNEGPEGEWPHVRLLACNKGWRRAAHGTRVIVEGYRPLGRPAREMTTLGSPLLGWPSAPELPDGGLSIFPGARRPVELGYLVTVAPRDRRPGPSRLLAANADGNVMVLTTPLDQGGRWHFRLGLAFGLAIADKREFIEPGEWTITLTIGADDSSPRTYDIDVAWVGDEPDSAAALAAILDHLAVRDAAS